MSFEELDEILKISPVVELKEDAENQVLKADFSGHLQLVSVSEDSEPGTFAFLFEDQALWELNTGGSV